MSATYYLKIDGISGDSTDAGFAGWFEIDGFSFGASSPLTATSATIGSEPSFQDLFVSLFDTTSLTALLSRISTGFQIGAIQLVGVDGAGQIFYDLLLNDVQISSVQTSGSDGFTSATSQISLNYQQLGLTTTSYNPDGTVDVSETLAWDLAGNTQIGFDDLAAPVSSATTTSADPVSYFLKIDGIAGNSTSEGHEGWFELPSFSFGEVAQIASGGGGAGTSSITFFDLNLILLGNTALADLLSLNASGGLIAALEIEGVAAGGQTVYDLTLNAVKITSVQQGGIADDVSTSVSVSYQLIGLTTTVLTPEGTAGTVRSFGWDTATNSPYNPALLVAPVAGTVSEVPDPHAYFLKIDGIDGGSTVAGREGWFEVSSFSAGQVFAAAFSGSGSGGKVSFTDLSLTLFDQTSLSELLAGNAAGTLITALSLEGVNADGLVVYDLTLNDVLISSVQQSGADGVSPTTAISFAYGEIGLVTTSVEADGTAGPSHSFGWDVAGNVALDPVTLAEPVSADGDNAAQPVAYFVRIDGLAGDSIAKGHEGWFEIDALSFGQSNSGNVTSGGVIAGRASFSDISLALNNNTALAALLLDVASGKAISALEIEGVSADNQVVYDLTLNDVLVSSVSAGASGGAASGIFSFNFSKIGLVTTSLNADGTFRSSEGFGWNLADNSAIDPASLATPGGSAVFASPDPVQYFMRISGVPGDSTDAKFSGWLEVPSFSLGASNASAGGFGGAGEANFQNLSVVLQGNTALTSLLGFSGAGKFLPALEIVGVTASSQIVYDLRLNDVLVSSISQGASLGGNAISSISFDYGRIGLITTSITPNGTLGTVQSAGWNLQTNQSLTASSLIVPALLTPVPAGNPTSYFIKIDGVLGDSVSKGHEGWFEVSSLSFGTANNDDASDGQAIAGNLVFSDLFVSLLSPAALVDLLGSTVLGTAIAALQIEGVSNSGLVVYELTLNNIVVSSVSVSGNGDAAPSTTYSFSFAQFGLITTVDNNGEAGPSKEFGWDLADSSYINPATLIEPQFPVVTDTDPLVAIVSQLLDADTGTSALDRVTSDGHVTLTGTASDDGSIDSVHVFDGLTDLGAAVLDGASWTFSTVLSPGSHALYAVATDNTGNTAATSVQPSILVDTAAPSGSITTQVLTADTGTSAIDLITSDGRVTLTGTAADGTAVAGVRIFDGLTDLGAATLNGGDWSFSATLAPGSHALLAVITDTAGNTTSTAAGAPILVDAAGPAVAVTSQVLTADTGALAGDGITADGRVTLSGTVSDANGLAGVRIFDGATDLGAAIVIAGSWSFATTLAPGSHALRAVATDSAGNISETAAQPAIFVDQTAPTIAVTSQLLAADTGVSASDLVTSNGLVTLSGTAADNSSVTQVRVFDGAVDLGAAVLAAGVWTFTTTLAVGTHSLRAVATDAAGYSTATLDQPVITVLSSDPIVGTPGQTTVSGTSGADTIIFGGTNLLINGGGGNDLISIAAGSTYGFHYIDGGSGSDTLDLSKLTTASNVNLATMSANGPQIGFTYLASIENVIGGSAGDTITASDARNTFAGGGGADRFVWATLDAARNGGTFVAGTGDTITDFQSTAAAGAGHDFINLSGIDAIQGKKDDAFVFNATPWDGTGNQFTAAGQLRYQYTVDAAGQQHTIISGNVNAAGQGNGLAADFQIDLLGHIMLGAGDFVL